MRRFVEDVIDEDRHLFEKDGHVVTLDPKGGDARVAIDTRAMHVVLSNLIENAARYSPRGFADPVRLHRDIRSCRLDVIDTGDGIRRKDLKNMFKMFWRGDQNQRSRARGTGPGPLHRAQHRAATTAARSGRPARARAADRPSACACRV